MSSSKLYIVFSVWIVGCLLGLVSGHSQMRCAKYDRNTGACAAPIRNQGPSFSQESFVYNGGNQMCQAPMSNPIQASYANGADCPSWAPCPAPMGSYTPGETFTVMWFARNHAVANQSPATVFLYISPREAANQGRDVTRSQMQLLCQGPYANCGGQNVDQTPCTLTCTMPSNLEQGIYTLWWHWPWQGTAYSTCADINIVGGNSPSPSPAPTPSPTPAPIPAPPSQVITTGRITTGRITPTAVTTGRQQSSSSSSSTTGSRAVAGSTSTSSSGSTSCTQGFMRCMNNDYYQTCNRGAWGPNQQCNTGTTCSPSGNYIYCI